MISVVVPVYRCSTTLSELHQRLVSTMQRLSQTYELILVNDASPDDAWQVMKKLVDADTNVRAINLSRNFGQHYAITAGLQYARGELVVIMDGDLQDQPEEISKLYQALTPELAAVLGRRQIRRDDFAKKFSSRCFYFCLSYLTDTKLDPAIANFGIYRRKLIDAVLAMPEQIRFFPLMVRWVGFKTTTINIDHAERNAGKSSYSLGKLLRLAFDVITAFSDKPLRLTMKIGAIISCGAFVYALYILMRVALGLSLIPGWASVIVSIWFLAGLVIMLLGMIGVYIGRIFDQVKHRPLYVVDTIYERDKMRL